MDKSLRCKKCSKECTVIFKELSLNAEQVYGLCDACLGSPINPTMLIGCEKEIKDLLCPCCHSSLASITQGASMGCCGCYDVFSSEVAKLLIHLGSVPEKLRHFLEQDVKFQLHIGRTPFATLQPDIVKQIQELELSLEHALKTENYELAASYRDQLVQLKKTHNITSHESS